MPISKSFGGFENHVSHFVQFSEGSKPYQIQFLYDDCYDSTQIHVYN